MDCVKITRKISKSGKHLVLQNKYTQRTALENEECWAFLFNDSRIVSSDCKGTLENLFLCAEKNQGERWKSSLKLIFSALITRAKKLPVNFVLMVENYLNNKE